MSREYDLARYVTSILQVGERLVRTDVTDQGYLVTDTILDCLQVSRTDAIIGDLTEQLEHDAFTGAVLTKSSIGKYEIAIL